METKLSNRLKAVASFVMNGARLADIGSDHAYLPLYLVEKQRIDYAVAGEVVVGPYQSALLHVEKAGKANCIDVRLGNGLAAIEEGDNITTVTIAGMGGRLIRDILDEGIDKLAGVERLILQPNNREKLVRQWLQDNGFSLIAETILEENQKIYEVLVAERGRSTLSISELQFGPFLLANPTEVFRKKWFKELDTLTKAYQQIPLQKELERSILKEKMKRIEEVLHVS